MGPAQAAHVEVSSTKEAWSYFCVPGIAVRGGWSWEPPGHAREGRLSCRPAAWALRLPWHQVIVTGTSQEKLSLFPASQVFPEVGLSLVLGGV